jgi:hypothetical protein
MSKVETEALFFLAYNSFLLQKPEFKDYFEMLVDDYKHSKDSFNQFSKLELLKIKQMQDSYKTGKISIFEVSKMTESDIIMQGNYKSEKNHKDLCRELYLNREKSLEPFIGKIDNICFEFPIIYGNIDLMAICNKIAYIIEVKSTSADHSIIGQMMKYFVGLSLKLNLRHFNEVKMVTICPGYDEPSYKGLKQVGSQSLIVDPKTFIVSKF